MGWFENRVPQIRLMGRLARNHLWYPLVLGHCYWKCPSPSDRFIYLVSGDFPEASWITRGHCTSAVPFSSHSSDCKLIYLKIAPSQSRPKKIPHELGHLVQIIEWIAGIPWPRALRRLILQFKLKGTGRFARMKHMSFHQLMSFETYPPISPLCIYSNIHISPRCFHDMSYLFDHFRIPNDWLWVHFTQPGPYLIHDEASTPSDVLLQAKAEAGRTRARLDECHGIVARQLGS